MVWSGGARELRPEEPGPPRKSCRSGLPQRLSLGEQRLPGAVSSGKPVRRQRVTRGLQDSRARLSRHVPSVLCALTGDIRALLLSDRAQHRRGRAGRKTGGLFWEESETPRCTQLGENRKRKALAQTPAASADAGRQELSGKRGAGRPLAARLSWGRSPPTGSWRKCWFHWSFPLSGKNDTLWHLMLV